MRSTLLLLLMPFLLGCPSQPDRVVLYCAQDRDFAKEVLGTFRQRTNLNVAPKFDTEADKSVSLYVELIQDRHRPRCDVFWNNEILSTLRLQQQGMLQPYASPGAEPYPQWAKAIDHTWHAFAARARILIVNTAKLPPTQHPKSLFDLLKSQWQGKIVMARPHHGTSATQAACLFAFLGAEKAKDFYRSLIKNKVQLAPGNKQVAEWVAKGKAPGGQEVVMGITDTDDAMLEVKANRPVAIIFPDSEDKPDRIGTLFIPNTVAILRGGPNPQGAKRLVDYLLSEEIEQRLATEGGYQFPLNPNADVKMPMALEPFRTAKRMEVDWAEAAKQWEEVQTFLRNILARPG